MIHNYKLFYFQSGPEKFQDCPKEFEIILTVEEKVYDQVLECFNSRDSVSETPVHVINMNVVDNPEDATIGAFLLCELAQLLTSRFITPSLHVLNSIIKLLVSAMISITTLMISSRSSRGSARGKFFTRCCSTKIYHKINQSGGWNEF